MSRIPMTFRWRRDFAAALAQFVSEHLPVTDPETAAHTDVAWQIADRLEGRFLHAFETLTDLPNDGASSGLLASGIGVAPRVAALQREAAKMNRLIRAWDHRRADGDLARADQLARAIDEQATLVHDHLHRLRLPRGEPRTTDGDDARPAHDPDPRD